MPLVPVCKEYLHLHPRDCCLELAPFQKSWIHSQYACKCVHACMYACMLPCFNIYTKKYSLVSDHTYCLVSCKLVDVTEEAVAEKLPPSSVNRCLQQLFEHKELWELGSVVSSAQSKYLSTLPVHYKIYFVKKYAKITLTIKCSTITSSYFDLWRSTIAHQNP